MVQNNLYQNTLQMAGKSDRCFHVEADLLTKKDLGFSWNYYENARYKEQHYKSCKWFLTGIVPFVVRFTKNFLNMWGTKCYFNGEDFKQISIKRHIYTIPKLFRTTANYKYKIRAYFTQCSHKWNMVKIRQKVNLIDA